MFASRSFRLLNLLGLVAIVVSSPAFVEEVQKRATCTVTSAQNAGIDDVPAIEAALSECGNGGTIVISESITYSILSPLSFAGCSNCIFNIEGTLKMSGNTSYWEGRSAFIELSDITGATIQSTTGAGVVDGNGVPFWEAFAADSSYARPTLFVIANSKDITVQNLEFKNPANVFHSVNDNSQSVTYSGLNLIAETNEGIIPKNTDGFDVGPASYVTISDVTVSNQDDCIAFKSGANFVTVTNITCTGSHGLSVGSLGESSGNIVQNIYVNGATMIDSAKAVGIKLWDGESGHGAATVSNVTYANVVVQNSDYAAQIQSCYEAASTSICEEYPSASKVTGVYFENFSGTTSTTYEPVIANLNCPADGTCDIYFSGWSVKSPSGSGEYLCSNVDESTGLPCSGAASG